MRFYKTQNKQLIQIGFHKGGKITITSENENEIFYNINEAARKLNFLGVIINESD